MNAMTTSNDHISLIYCSNNLLGAPNVTLPKPSCIGRMLIVLALIPNTSTPLVQVFYYHSYHYYLTYPLNS